MHIQSFKYEQFLSQPSEWTVGPVELSSAVLVVGKNAAGKSRLLSVLWSLANILQGRKVISSGTWHLTFQNDVGVIEYKLSSGNGVITEEELRINGTIKLSRLSDGTGVLDASGTGAPLPLRFQVPTSSIAVVAKRDLLQHAYLEPLHQWAASVRYYQFGTEMGRDTIGILSKDAPPADPSDWRRTLGLFIRANKEFPATFKTSVQAYMERLGYLLDDISVDHAPVAFIATEQPIPGQLVCLAVKERDLSCLTTQFEMSQGMFRALALMIHLAYAELSGQSGCILLDDVGEGLDYERSSEMIKLLLEIAAKNKVQVLMSTNDRFVMNAVPLEQWAIIRRKRSHCEILTYKNSRDMFEDFRLTGLSNFDLLRSGFFEHAPPV